MSKFLQDVAAHNTKAIELQWIPLNRNPVYRDFQLFARVGPAPIHFLFRQRKFQRLIGIP